MKSSLEAVIEIGSTGIRLLVGEISDSGSWNIVDRSELPAALGWDVFTTGTVARGTLLQCLRILDRFKEQLSSWAIDERHLTVIATSALREAQNRDVVLDRIFVKTGFKVIVIDGIEENRLLYIAVLHSLESEISSLKNSNSAILEIGGGSTEIMLLEKGRMAAVHSLRFGTVIIEQHIRSMMGSSKDAARFLEEYIHNAGVNMNTEVNLEKVDNFITIGSEARLAAHYAGKKISEHCGIVSRADFFDFADEVRTYSADECAAQFKIPYSEAASLGTGLLSCKLFIGLTQADTILVPDSSIRDGIIISKAAGAETTLQQEFLMQTVASARNLGRKYQIDEKHADFVRQASLRLFDFLKAELGLNSRARTLLEIAALLHDTGMFIKGTDHQLHSQYIIAHSDLFGLNRDDINIVSQVARYHRGAPPDSSDANFYAMPRTDRITVQKLAAILRIADALDRGHNQRISSFDIELKKDAMILHLHGVHDIIPEKSAVSEKGDMFEAVFGYKIQMA
ncbi:MAG: HD domain-containing protein [Bacteroides sp.]|nr:HD domain-containing protein [Prevotella sp.]MCM1407126.1 HD domain-containing protein [Treponema brennaborense]MCM1470278.1 HD domain-containing protein [Bacteroides sp.]